MVIPDRDAGFGWGEDLDDEIRKLVEMVTELGIEADDILFNAVTALLGEGNHGAQKAREAGDECETRYQLAHQRGLELIVGGRANADQARWILELQETGQAFRSVAQDAVWIAAQSLAMQQPAEDVLELAGTGLNLLEFLVAQTRLQVRSVIYFAASRDRDYAREILERAIDPQRAYIMLETQIHKSIREYPRESFPMQQLLGIAARLESIGKACRTLANTVLFDPPSQH